MTNIYSLADYIVTLSFTDGDMTGQKISIGGPAEASGVSGSNAEGGFIGSIAVSRTNPAWSIDGDVTGGFVHNRNCSRIGEVVIQIRQVSDKVRLLKEVLNRYEQSSRPRPFNILVTDAYNSSKWVAKCTSCLISKIPNQVFGESAAMQDWAFNAGIVEFNGEK